MRSWTNRKKVTSDGLDPMVRLLRQVDQFGMVFVEYDQQWKTLFKAQKLGLVDDNQRLTDLGKKHL